GLMNEAFLTGEPFEIKKAPGSTVISGSVNGGTALTITATRQAVDSRYAKIMEVMRESEQNQPRMRRLGDQLGAFYTPVAVGIAILAWIISGDPIRFLAVLVIATPCPLLIAIPIAVIGSISLAARRSIIIRNPAALEQVGGCRTAIFDKTGTLTYGEPKLTDQVIAPGFERKEVLILTAALELYSKHPLATAILQQAKADDLTLPPASDVSEPPGQGLVGMVSGRQVRVTGRNKIAGQNLPGAEHLPPVTGGLECVIVIDGRFAATYRLHDAPRAEGASFIRHLGPRHQFEKIMILSGDRESEVLHLAGQLGIREVHAEQSPEQKLAMVRQETGRGGTLYVGDGINDAPAMLAATVGVAVGRNSDITAEAADAVVMDGNLEKVDEFLHISRRMRSIALQSAVGGMVLSLGGMIFAAAGHLSPVAGAISQEIIDVLAVLNALRAAFPPRVISDLHQAG
ncbi:MAG: heavy metal translocating P-type ATPase, partial [Verrucomicrobiaceae bacterium]